MSSDMEQPPRDRARRHFLGVAGATGVKVAATVAAMTTLPYSPAHALGRRWKRKKDRDNDNGDPRCFLRGTAIMTPAGEVCVENLRIGDLVETVRGQAVPVKWIGRQTYRRSGLSWQESVKPIRIARGAIDARTPHRDLYLSPNHALFIDGVLIRVKELVNGITIAPALPTAREIIEYFAIVLDTHEVILAEGAPAETFLLRASNHESFNNFAEFERLRPAEGLPVMAPYAPIVGYEGGREHLTALIRLATPRFMRMRDPICDAYERIAARAEAMAG
ncbi:MULTISPECIES: Hint domain-containing protein [unclassified Sinorhizobium]|uniref:Hint domain-containing protein n=1 Tax=unclassified Sinorhizobium TaxID=2613772 RepID=UPI003523660C